jgi:hypothetical protein
MKSGLFFCGYAASQGYLLSVIPQTDYGSIQIGRFQSLMRSSWPVLNMNDLA